MNFLETRNKPWATLRSTWTFSASSYRLLVESRMCPGKVGKMWAERGEVWRHPLQVLILSHANDGLEKVLGRESPAEQEGFTQILPVRLACLQTLIQSIVSPTYRRLETLPKFLDNYTNGNLTSLRKIILLWNDIENDPRLLSSISSTHTMSQSSSSNDTSTHSTSASTRARISRLIPEVIEFGYQVWKDQNKGRQRMLGFVA
ncbi:hypothetical protein BST61_g9808 [Cercospora zeina]